MPEDASQLHAGWTGSTDSPPVGRVSLEIREYDPPTRLEYRSVYHGGDAIASYRLVEGDGVTTLTLEGDTDWARPEGTWDELVDTALAGQPESVRGIAEAQLDAVEAQLDGGQFDGMAQSQMQQSLDASLQKLKALIEAA